LSLALAPFLKQETELSELIEIGPLCDSFYEEKRSSSLIFSPPSSFTCETPTQQLCGNQP
jgi:hypothetical protein